jgi:alpha-D-xyloside xylohydrolase
MQVGDSSSQPPWVYTPENGRSDRTLDLYRAYARLHLRLFPYVWTFVTRNQTDGRAILRPLGLAHPELGIHPRHDYLLGDDILVAPVTARGARRRRVTLPEGRWLDGWTGETMEAPPGGLSFEADTPLERIPFFLRGGAVIPRLRPEVDTLAPAEAPGVDSAANEPGRLWVWVAGPPRRRETFEVFDGARVTSTPEAGGFRLELAPGERFVNGAVFEVLGAAPPSALEGLEGAPIPERADLDALRAADAGFVRASDRTFVKPPGAGVLWR